MDTKNPLISIVFTIAIPALILSKFSSPDRLGPLYALLVAVAFPAGFLIYGIVREQTYDKLAILGLVSVLLTGALGLMEARAIWFAVKEAVIPLVLGVAVIAGAKGSQTMVESIFFNEKVLDVKRLHQRILEKGNQGHFDRMMRYTNWAVAASFFLSATLNFGLTFTILKSVPGSEAFNAELARIAVLSYPVIVGPTLLLLIVTLVLVMRSLSKLLGTSIEEFMHKK